MIYIIVLILLAQLAFLASLRAKNVIFYYFIGSALALLICIQILKTGSDPNLDPIVFATTYTSEQINNPILIGRHLLIPYITHISTYLPHYLAKDSFHQLSLTIFGLSLFFSVGSLCLVTRRKDFLSDPRAVSIFFIFSLSCPSSILLLNNFISQSLSAMLCIAAFCIFEYATKNRLVLNIFAIILLLLAAFNHSSALYLISLYLFQRVFVIVLKRLKHRSISLSKYSLVLGAACLSAIYMLLLSLISAYLLANDSTSDYASGFDDVTPDRLIARMIYPYLIALILFSPSIHNYKKVFNISLFRVSFFGSLSAILIFITGMKGVAWRLEYYASFLAAFSFCASYYGGSISLEKNLLSPTRISTLLVLTALPYFYSNVSRLFI